jgi:hypothetical protein
MFRLKPAHFWRAGPGLKVIFLIVVKRLAVFLTCAVALSAQADGFDNFNTMGVTLLRQVDPTLNGSGVRVAVVEAPETSNPNAFQIIPSSLGQPVSLFTYINSSNATSTAYPNALGIGSAHATSVGGNFFGMAYPHVGVSTNVSHVNNYEASNFYNRRILTGTGIPAMVVNQSFNFETNGQPAIEFDYDNYTASRKTLFITGGGNGGSIKTNPPGTAYNGIAVGVYPGDSAVGPTSDGRCKPDITAPGFGVTSFSAPYVSGAAALLRQAVTRGDGGANSTVATNPISLKALLLNGAIKPADWTNSFRSPLDMRYGAGVVNIFNSWNQLKGGRHTFIETTTSANNTHPPGSNPTNVPALSGWDYNTVSTTTSQHRIKHYYFNLPGSNTYTLTATLAWNRQLNKGGINNLDLFLYNTANSNLVLCSTSAVDNVEHLFLPELAPGRYDLQVMKRASPFQFSTQETYALAFEFFSMPLNIVLTNGNIRLSWPVAPTGFRLVSATNLNSSTAWAAINTPVNIAVSKMAVSLTNDENVVSIPTTGGAQFFRLQRP